MAAHGDQQYGAPRAGSKAEARGRAAHARLSGEVVELCAIIKDHGGRANPPALAAITFGELFSIYVRISNKLVGVLLRARKHGLVHFEGETLFQGQDDKKTVTLLAWPEEAAAKAKKSAAGEAGKGFQWGECMG